MVASTMSSDVVSLSIMMSLVDCMKNSIITHEAKGRYEAKFLSPPQRFKTFVIESRSTW